MKKAKAAKVLLTLEQELAFQRAARRKAVIDEYGVQAWQMSGKVVPSRKGNGRNVPRWEHRHYRYDQSLWDED